MLLQLRPYPEYIHKKSLFVHEWIPKNKYLDKNF